MPLPFVHVCSTIVCLIAQAKDNKLKKKKKMPRLATVQDTSTLVKDSSPYMSGTGQNFGVGLVNLL